jgi:Holliday junction resolvase RusA-like endonuclease
MGYYTTYEIGTIPDEDLEAVKASIEKLLDFSPFEDCCKWYDHENDLREVSKFHPSTVISLAPFARPTAGSCGSPASGKEARRPVPDHCTHGRKTSIVVPSKTAKKGKARVVLSAGYRQWREYANGLMRRAMPSMLTASPWRDGPLAVTVSAYWLTCNRTGAAADIARGDVDAVAKACLDALEHAGVLTDDAQVVSLTCAKAHDRRDPRIEIEVRRAQ